MNRQFASTVLRRCLVLHSLACLGLVSLHARDAGPMEKQAIIAERRSAAGVRVLIAVDTDDVVHEIGIGLPDTKGEAVVTANLGTRVIKSGTIDIASVLPAEKVATAARRVTLANGAVIHVLVVWGFSSFPDLLAPHCSLYLLREQQGKVTQVFVQELGVEMNQFVVEDFDGDGKFEILIATGENAIESMYVWQVQQDGQAKKLQRISGSHVHTIADRFMNDEIGVYVEHESDKSIPGGVCYKTEGWVWSRKQQRFVKTPR